jgi:hypothetical protein
LICDTHEGDILAHIAKSLEAALECQAKPYIITSGSLYIGTAILGTKFHLFVNNKKYESLPQDVFMACMRNIDAHSSSLSRILDLAAYDGEPSSINSMRDLRKMLISAKLSAQDRETILTLAVNLSFQVPFWVFNYVNIMSAISLISRPEEPISSSIPMHHSMLLTDDRIEEVLSAFGVNAPTFLFMSSTRYDVTEEGLAPLKGVSARWVPLVDAVLDMKKLMSERYITQPKALPSSSNATIRTFNEATRLKELKSSLITLALSGPDSDIPSEKKDIPKNDDNVDFF